MTDDPWALAIHSFSVVVKREAIINRFDGGVAEFERFYNPPRKNGALSLIVCSSLADVDQVRHLLMTSGLRPGRDYTVADMMHGPLEPYPGLKFKCEGEFPGIRWTVALHEDGTEAQTDFVRPDEFPTKSYHIISGENGDQSLLVKFEKDEAETQSDPGPTQVQFRTEPVHRECEGEGSDRKALSNGAITNSNFALLQAPEGAYTTLHTIRIQYTTGLLASHDCWEVEGEVEIDVDGSSLSRIQMGAELELEPITVRQTRCDPDLQWESFLWRFNDPKPGNCTIIVPVEDDANDWLEAVAVWIDGEEQSAPPRYWDE